MDGSESQTGVSRGEDDLPAGKVKAWLFPNVPISVTVANSHEALNVAHREGQFQVKLHERSSWEDVEAIAWGEQRSYDTAGQQAFAVRNKGTVSLSLRYV